jgi:hypothetical protein
MPRCTWAHLHSKLAKNGRLHWSYVSAADRGSRDSAPAPTRLALKPPVGLGSFENHWFRDCCMNSLKRNYQLRSISRAHSVALQSLEPKYSLRRRRGMDASTDRGLTERPHGDFVTIRDEFQGEIDQRKAEAMTANPVIVLCYPANLTTFPLAECEGRYCRAFTLFHFFCCAALIPLVQVH